MVIGGLSLLGFVDGITALGIIISSIPIALSIYAAYIFYIAVEKNI